eukprot:403343282
MKTKVQSNKPQATKAVTKPAKKADQIATKDNLPKAKAQAKIADKKTKVSEQKSDQNQAAVVKNQSADSKPSKKPQVDKNAKTKAIAKKRDVKQINKVVKKDVKAAKNAKKPNISAQSTKDIANKPDQKMEDVNQNIVVDGNQQPKEQVKAQKVTEKKAAASKTVAKPAAVQKKSQIKKAQPQKAQKGKKVDIDDFDDDEDKEVLVGKKRTARQQAVAERKGKPIYKAMTLEESEEEEIIDTNIAKPKSAAPSRAKPSMPKGNAKKLLEIPPEHLVYVTQPELFDPDTIEEDYKYSTAKHLLNTECCVNCTNKNVFRAVMTKNHDLLRKCLESTKQISTLLLTWSPELKWTPMEWIFYNDDMESFDILMKYDMDKKKHSRVIPPAFRLSEFDTGQVSDNAYGVEVRKVLTARGNRAGNEAFLQEQGVEEPTFRQYLQNQYFIQRLMIMQSLKYEHFEKLMALDKNMHDFVINQLVQKLLIHGKREIAEKIIKLFVDDPLYQVNKLMHQVILANDLKDLPDNYNKLSVLKKSDKFSGIIPLHSAALNPNIEILKKLMNMISSDKNQKYMTDQFQNQCIHYAAACENPGNLELLLARDMNLNFANAEKETPIFIAIKCNRSRNVLFIVQEEENSIHHKDGHGYYPIHLAAKLGYNDCIRALCKIDKKYVDTLGGYNKLTPLMYAAQYGHFDTVQYLVKTQRANLNLEDKFKRNALTYAVRNGHLKIAAFLLQNMAFYNYPDNSNNLPLHFACAYGWIDCVKLLIKAGANVNCKNEWGYTPIMIAMLKNHQHIVKELLDVDGVDINGTDEQGRSLLTFSLQTISEENLLYIKYLIEEKKADPHQEDINGRTPLYYALEAPLPILYEKMALDDPSTMNIQQKLQEQQQMHLKILNYLINDLGCKIDHVDKSGVSIIDRIISSNKIYLLPIIIDQIDFENNPDFLIRFKPMQLINSELFDKLKRSNISEEYLNGVTNAGYSILMHFIRQFIQDKSLINNITQYLVLKRIINLAHHFEQFGNYEDIEPRSTYFHQFVKNIKDIEGDLNFMIDYSPNQLIARDKLSISKEKIAEAEGLINKLDDQKISGRIFADKAANTIFKELVAKKYLSLLEVLISKGADVNQYSFNVSYLASEIKIPEALQLCSPQIDKEQKVRKQIMIVPISKLENQNIAQKVLEDLAECQMRLQQNTIQSQLTQADTRAKQAICTRRGLTSVITQVKNANIIKLLINKGLDINQTTETNQSLIIQMTKDLTNDPKRFINIYQELKKSEDLNKDAVDENGNNAFLLAFQNKSMKIATFLLEEGFNADSQNKQLKTALIVAVQRNDFDSIKMLIERNCNPNVADNEGKTALHYATQSSNLETVKYLIEKGCNVNNVDRTKSTALHYAVKRIDFDFVELLLENNSELNISDNQGRTALHYAVNSSSAGLDANYDIENILISSGANVNIQDKVGRTPLHYAFVKLGNGNMDRSAMDPIETVSSLCSIKDADPKIQDKYGKNVLHYAAQRGATISTMYLQKKGVDLHQKDIFENTPLATALLCNHTQYAIMLIKDGSDVNQLVHQESKEAYQEYKRKQKSQRMSDILEDGYKSNDSYFKANVQQNNNQYSHFNQGLFGNRNIFGGQQVSQNQNPSIQFKEPQTMFKLAVDSGQLGLSYLILDNGFDLFQAMEDSLKKLKFQFVLTLLSKVSDNSVILKCNSKGQNLFHIFAQNSASLNPDDQKKILNRIYKQFKRRELDAQQQDNFGRTPLHYAAIHGAYSLVKELILEQDININAQDKKGFTPLILSVRGNRLVQRNNFEVFKILIEAGVNSDQLYYDYMYKDEQANIKNQQDLMNVDMIDTTQKPQKNGEYKVTPYIHFIRQMRSMDEIFKKDYSNLFFGKHCNQDLFGKDSNGKNALFILNEKNQIQSIYEIFKFWESNHAEDQIKPTIKDDIDSEGRNLVHLLVTSNKFGIYDNVQFFNFLVEKGFAYDIVDKYHKRPVDYASQFRHSEIYKKLIKLGQQRKIWEEDINQNPFEDLEMICTDSEIDFEKDAKEFLAKNKDKIFQKVEKKLFPDSILGEQAKVLEVVCEDPDNLDTAYQAHLIKIDIKKYGHSSYVFYKIQLNFDPTKKIYVLLTRWGMIGEQGACQKTPFSNLEDAVAELKKIFKNKTSNNWEDRANFEIPKAKAKYILFKKQNFDVSYTDLLKPFKYSECQRSNLNEQAQTFLKLISNIGMYSEVLKLQNIQKSQINMTNIPKEKLEEAKMILDELEQTYSKNVSNDSLEFEDQQKQVVMLTCKLYELIPMLNENQEFPKPVAQAEIVQLRNKFDDLSTLERVSKMFLGAYNALDTTSPLDYIYRALNMKVDILEKEQVINNVFRIKRNGDDDIFKQNGYNNDPHRFLLCHGTSLENLMGIMNRGFKVSPLGVSQCGAIFGQGVYFSNALEKSFGYARATNFRQMHLGQEELDQINDERELMSRRYIIICEVAMGKIFKHEQSVTRNQNNNYGYHYGTQYQNGYYAIGTQKQLKVILEEMKNTTTTVDQEVLEDQNMQSDYEDESDYDEENDEKEDVIIEEEEISEQIKTEKKEEEPVYKDQITKLANGKIILGKDVDITRTLRGHKMMQIKSQNQIKNFDTLWVSGTQVPDPQFNVLLKDGSIVPNGKPVPAQERNQAYRQNGPVSSMLNQQQNQFQLTQFYGQEHSEFVVKNPNRIKIRYIVEIREQTQTEVQNQVTKTIVHINDDEDI